jgi:hypothetical protein
MKIRDLVNFDMLFPNMQRKIYLRDLVFEIFATEFRPLKLWYFLYRYKNPYFRNLSKTGRNSVANISKTKSRRYIFLCIFGKSMSKLTKSRIFMKKSSQSFFVTRVTWWVPLVDQELLNLLRHLSYPLAFSRIRVVQSLVFCVAFCWSLSALLVPDPLMAPIVLL